MTDSLDQFALRIERLVVDPSSIRPTWTRRVRTLFSKTTPLKDSSTAAIEALISGLAAWDERQAETIRDAHRRLGEAIEELDNNIDRVECATLIAGGVLTAHAAWLRRLYEIVARAKSAIDQTDLLSILEVNGIDPLKVVPPLVSNGTGLEARIVELQLSAADRLIDIASSEVDMLSRKRSLLEAARGILLETSAAITLDHHGVDMRLRSIGRQITRIDRLQASGLLPDVALLHQAQTALSRGERQRLFSAICAMKESAISNRDRRTKVELIAERLARGTRLDSPNAIAASVARSGEETIGTAPLAAIARGALEARGPSSLKERAFERAMVDFTAPGRQRAMLSAALSVDGTFDLGAAMSPVRVKEFELKHEDVPFPADAINLVATQSIEDLPNALINDPRALVLELAQGKLLTRRFVRERPIERETTKLQGEARIYLLDGSGSMDGPRGSMRDAILIAELATLARRLTEQARTTRVVLFFSYFTTKLGPIIKIDKAKEAIEAISSVAATKHWGETDIQRVLLQGFAHLRDVKQADPDLSRAQIVIITDGLSEIESPRIARAREEVGEIPVGVSVIALGEQNPALRAIVARQRSRGERAFYHFMSDQWLTEIADGRIDGGAAIHLPPLVVDGFEMSPRKMATELQALVGELVEELAAMESNLLPNTEGEHARIEAGQRDERALSRRYRRWFPEPPSPGAPAQTLPETGTVERDDLETALVLLATVAEVVELFEGSDILRQAEAIELLERLLPDARFSPARYQFVVTTWGAHLERAIESVHASVRYGITKRLYVRR